MAVAPIELDSRGAKALRERVPGGGLRVGPQHRAGAAARGARRALPRRGGRRRGDPRDGHRAEPRISVRYPSPPLWHGYTLEIRCLPLALDGRAAARRRRGLRKRRPPGAVAKVGDTTITQDEFDKWLKTAAKSQAQGGRPPCPTRPTSRSAWPPRRRRRRRRARRKQTDAALKKQCKTEYDTLKREVMQFLIQAEWVQQEAEKRDIKVCDASVKQVLRGPEEAGLPDRQGLPAVPQDLRHDRGGHPLPRQARRSSREAHPEGHRGRHEGLRRGRPGVLRQEQEALRPARAARPARRADQDRGQGRARPSRRSRAAQPWKTVVKQYSIDEASKAQGGKLRRRRQGPAGQGARRRRVRRRARASSRARSRPSSAGTCSRSRRSRPPRSSRSSRPRDTIKNLLRSQRQQKALDAFIKDFREEYKDETNCSDDYRVAECKNAPKDDRHRREPVEPAAAASSSRSSLSSRTPEPQTPTPEK